MQAMEVIDEPAHFGTYLGKWYATKETRLKTYLGGHSISQPTAGMCSLHPEEVDPSSP